MTRDPIDRGTMPLPVIRDMIERQARRDEMARFADLRDGGNLPQWRPSLAVWFVAALSVAAMLGMIWGGAAIIQWKGM
jgi:hypothetical protein